MNRAKNILTFQLLFTRFPQEINSLILDYMDWEISVLCPSYKRSTKIWKEDLSLNTFQLSQVITRIYKSCNLITLFSPSASVPRNHCLCSLTENIRATPNQWSECVLSHGSKFSSSLNVLEEESDWILPLSCSLVGLTLEICAILIPTVGRRMRLCSKTKKCKFWIPIVILLMILVLSLTVSILLTYFLCKIQPLRMAGNIVWISERLSNRLSPLIEKRNFLLKHASLLD